ncbi:chaplin [Streptomyces antimicrobicus]|uniref:Chaplin n=1 Tax=Streptomyces antimicrobicus TaxID=2883108 RepID=A0ABS8BG44_9ACTN|nr:chaplin [Streptomyces antimicrobicus]MCB5183504.1 chaplin [Streptomyces antimicrobicus]
MRQVLSRQVLGKGVLTAAAASSLLSIAGGAAYAYSGGAAEASHSPGVLAGNSVSVPITLSPNVCGNSVDGGAGLNPAFGNTCVNSSGHDSAHSTHSGHDSGHDGGPDRDRSPDYARYLSPEHAEAFQHYLEERQYEPRHAKPRPADGAEEIRRHVPHQPRHAQRPPAHEEHGRGGYGGAEEECDDHPAPPPAPHHAPPAPKPEAGPEPKPAPATETLVITAVARG